ncbi:MAG TPA: hypothetical protein VFN61_06310 [Acidimicrobiales bacterium]|nr:hypothetical protein [Acidimicrobiales bacterium]
MESDLIVARQAVEHLDDLLFVLACTVQDVDKEMRAEGNNSRAAQCLDWLLDAARPLIGAGESLRPAHQEDVHTEERGDGDAGAEKG